MKQPFSGTVVTLIAIVVSLVFISFFEYGDFTGWVSVVLMSLIPTQVLIGTIWHFQHPAALDKASQPGRGLGFVAITLVLGAVAGLFMVFAVGKGEFAATPMLIQATILSVVLSFFVGIVFGGWPFAQFKNPWAQLISALVFVYVLTLVLFNLFFDFSFMAGAPVYNQAQDPGGLFNAWNAIVYGVTCVSVMFIFLNLELWPFRLFPSVMKQPVLGVVFILTTMVVALAVFCLCMGVLGMDPVGYLVLVPIPVIFGSIVVLTMLQDSLYSGLQGLGRGVAKAATSVVVGSVLSWVFSLFTFISATEMPAGPPAYAYELWLASALLSVTFPLMIFLADYFQLQQVLGKSAQQSVQQ